MSSQRILATLEIVTIGGPFCVFKLLTGDVLLGGKAAALGYALIALGVVDVVINAANVVPVITGRARLFGVCFLDGVVRKWRPRWGELGVAIDVLLSFVLVAAMLGFGEMSALPAWGARVWTAAVILNVLGAGIGRVGAEVGRLRERG